MISITLTVTITAGIYKRAHVKRERNKKDATIYLQVSFHNDIVCGEWVKERGGKSVCVCVCVCVWGGGEERGEKSVCVCVGGGGGGKEVEGKGCLMSQGDGYV